MIWAIPLAMAAMSAMKAKRQGEQQASYNKGQAEVTRYSPLTGQTGQMDHSDTPSMLEGGVAGGIQGLGVAQGVEGGMGTASAGAAAPAAGGVNMASGAGALGGQQMSQQMAQDFSQPVADQGIGQFGMQKPMDYSQFPLTKPSLFAQNK